MPFFSKYCLNIRVIQQKKALPIFLGPIKIKINSRFHVRRAQRATTAATRTMNYDQETMP
jgi:hypothetical protein